MGEPKPSNMRCKCLQDAVSIIVENTRSTRSHEILLGQAPGSSGSNDILLVQDPRSPVSRDNIVSAGSKIPKIPRKNESTESKISQDHRCWILRIYDSEPFWDLCICLPATDLNGPLSAFKKKMQRWKGLTTRRVMPSMTRSFAPILFFWNSEIRISWTQECGSGGRTICPEPEPKCVFRAEPNLEPSKISLAPQQWFTCNIAKRAYVAVV